MLERDSGEGGGGGERLPTRQVRDPPSAADRSSRKPNKER